MAQKTLKINIFPVFSLLIREFWIKNISILLQILHTPYIIKRPLVGRFDYISRWSNANCFALRRDSKSAAIFLFECKPASAKHERQKPRGRARAKFPSGNLCRENPSPSVF